MFTKHDPYHVIVNVDRHIARLWNANDPQGVRVKHLLYKVLERAIIDATSKVRGCCVKVDRAHILKARQWFNKKINLENPEPFTFSWICIALELSPYDVRREVEKRIMEKNYSTKKASYGILTLFEAIHDDPEPISVTPYFEQMTDQNQRKTLAA